MVEQTKNNLIELACFTCDGSGELVAYVMGVAFWDGFCNCEYGKAKRKKREEAGEKFGHGCGGN